MNFFFNKTVPVKAGFFTFLILLWLSGGSPVSALDRGTYKQLKTFTEVMDIVDKNYVEPVESKKLLQGAINGMMKTLDPHSAFMTEEMYQELEVETKGSFGGIGIEITILKDVLTVVSPIEDTPAFLAGIKAGDQIIKIDGQSTKDITILEAVTKLRGPKDSKVTITVAREGFQKPRDFTMARALIQIKSIKSKIFDNQIGYLRISSFQERTVDDLKRALQELGRQSHTLRGLVLDMRNNPGGLLAQSIEVSDAFLKSGEIVSIKGRIKNMESKAVAKDDGDEVSCPMVVLVNEGTASAAEIVSGALQDNGRALILGVQTFGKGSVQTVIPLEEGAALKLTTAKYYTPRGRSIQAEGITPDIVVKYAANSEENGLEAETVRERDLKGHIKAIGEDGKKPAELQKKRVFDDASQDNQLKAALDILKSWEVFQVSRKI